MSNFTPAPWRVCADEKPYGKPYLHRFVIDSPSRACMFVAECDAQLSAEVREVRANARLAAAAPDMYAEIREALAHFCLLGSGQKPALSNAEMCEKLGAILAKIDGEGT